MRQTSHLSDLVSSQVISSHHWLYCYWSSEALPPDALPVVTIGWLSAGSSAGYHCTTTFCHFKPGRPPVGEAVVSTCPFHTPQPALVLGVTPTLVLPPQPEPKASLLSRFSQIFQGISLVSVMRQKLMFQQCWCCSTTSPWLCGDLTRDWLLFCSPRWWEPSLMDIFCHPYVAPFLSDFCLHLSSQFAQDLVVCG